MTRLTCVIPAMLLLSTVLVLPACSGGDPAAPTASESAPPSGPGDAEEVTIPTAEEADAAAETEITEANADQEFENLMREIEAESPN